MYLYKRFFHIQIQSDDDCNVISEIVQMKFNLLCCGYFIQMNVAGRRLDYNHRIDFAPMDAYIALKSLNIYIL